MGGFQVGKRAKTGAVTDMLLATSRRIAYLEAPNAQVFVADAEKQELQKTGLDQSDNRRDHDQVLQRALGRRLFSTSKSHVRRLQP